MIRGYMDTGKQTLQMPVELFDEINKMAKENEGLKNQIQSMKKKMILIKTKEYKELEKAIKDILKAIYDCNNNGIILEHNIHNETIQLYYALNNIKPEESD